MKKLAWALSLLLLLTACGHGKEAVEGNLILTNYASKAISNITVEYDGEALSSEAAISGTQLCSFTLPEKEGLAYTVSFETEEGGTVSQTFTGSFAGGTAVYLQIGRAHV